MERKASFDEDAGYRKPKPVSPQNAVVQHNEAKSQLVRITAQSSENVAVFKLG